MAEERGSSAIWQALQSGDIRGAAHTLSEKGFEALANPKLSILEDVLPLALQSLASSYDANGIVGDEDKYFDLARELWRFMSDTERSIPEMVCTFLYAGCKFNQPGFVRWILPIVASHPSVDMPSLAGDRQYQFNQLRHSAIYYIARNGNIELYDLLTSACSGVSPLLLECTHYEAQAVSVTIASTATRPRGASHGAAADIFAADTMLASGVKGGEAPDPPSLYVALKAGQTAFVRHCLACMPAQAQARLLRMTVVYGILPADDMEAAKTLYAIACESGPEPPQASGAQPHEAEAGSSRGDRTTDGPQSHPKHGVPSRHSSDTDLQHTAELTDGGSVSSATGARIVDPVTCLFGFGAGRDEGQAPGHAVTRSRTVSEASVSMLSTVSDLTVSSAIPPDVSSIISPAPLLSSKAGTELYSPFHCYALHLCVFTAEGSAEPNARRKRPASRYAAWLLRTFKTSVLKPLGRMRWSGATSLLFHSAHGPEPHADEIRLRTVSSPARPHAGSVGPQGQGQGSNPPVHTMWANWTALHSAAAAPGCDMVQRVLAVDKQLLHVAAVAIGQTGTGAAAIPTGASEAPAMSVRRGSGPLEATARPGGQAASLGPTAGRDGSDAGAPAAADGTTSSPTATLYAIRVAVETCLWSNQFEGPRVLAQWLSPSVLETQLYAPLRAYGLASLRPAFIKTLCKETGCLSIRSFKQSPATIAAAGVDPATAQTSTASGPRRDVTGDATAASDAPISISRTDNRAAGTAPTSQRSAIGQEQLADAQARGDDRLPLKDQLQHQHIGTTLSDDNTPISPREAYDRESSESPVNDSQLRMIAGSTSARHAVTAIERRERAGHIVLHHRTDGEHSHSGRSRSGSALSSVSDGTAGGLSAPLQGTGTRPGVESSGGGSSGQTPAQGTAGAVVSNTVAVSNTSGAPASGATPNKPAPVAHRGRGRVGWHDEYDWASPSEQADTPATGAASASSQAAEAAEAVSSQHTTVVSDANLPLPTGSLLGRAGRLAADDHRSDHVAGDADDTRGFTTITSSKKGQRKRGGTGSSAAVLAVQQPAMSAQAQPSARPASPPPNRRANATVVASANKQTTGAQAANNRRPAHAGSTPGLPGPDSSQRPGAGRPTSSSASVEGQTGRGTLSKSKLKTSSSSSSIGDKVSINIDAALAAETAASVAAAAAGQEARDAQIAASVSRSRSVAGLAALSHSPERAALQLGRPAEAFAVGGTVVDLDGAGLNTSGSSLVAAPEQRATAGTTREPSPGTTILAGGRGSRGTGPHSRMSAEGAGAAGAYGSHAGDRSAIQGVDLSPGRPTGWAEGGTWSDAIDAGLDAALGLAPGAGTLRMSLAGWQGDTATAPRGHALPPPPPGLTHPLHGSASHARSPLPAGHGTALPLSPLLATQQMVAVSGPLASPPNQAAHQHTPSQPGIERVSCPVEDIEVDKTDLLETASGPLRGDIYNGHWGTLECDVLAIDQRGCALPSWVGTFMRNLTLLLPNTTAAAGLVSQMVPERVRLSQFDSLQTAQPPVQTVGFPRLQRVHAAGLGSQAGALYLACEPCVPAMHVVSAGTLAPPLMVNVMPTDPVILKARASAGSGLLACMAQLHGCGLTHGSLQPGAVGMDDDYNVVLRHTLQAQAWLEAVIHAAEEALGIATSPNTSAHGHGQGTDMGTVPVSPASTSTGAAAGGIATPEGTSRALVSCAARLAACLQSLLSTHGDWCAPETLAALHEASQVAGSSRAIGSGAASGGRVTFALGSPSETEAGAMGSPSGLGRGPGGRLRGGPGAAAGRAQAGAAGPSAERRLTELLQHARAVQACLCSPANDAYACGLTLFTLLTGGGAMQGHACGPAWARQAGILSGRHALSGSDVDLGSGPIGLGMSPAGQAAARALGLEARQAAVIAALLRYKPDHRPGLAGALAALHG